MEKITFILSGMVVALAFWILRLSIRIRSIKMIEGNIKKLFEKIEIMNNRINHFQIDDLDLSTIESQVEENSQQMVNFVREGISSVRRDVQDLEKRFEELEEAHNLDPERVDEMEEKIENLESKIEEVDEEIKKEK